MSAISRIARENVYLQIWDPSRVPKVAKLICLFLKMTCYMRFFRGLIRYTIILKIITLKCDNTYFL